MQLWATHDDPRGRCRPSWLYLPAEQRAAAAARQEHRHNTGRVDDAPPFVVKLKLRDATDFVGLGLVDPPTVTSSTQTGALTSWTSAKSPSGVPFFWNREDRAVVVPGSRVELAPRIATIDAQGCAASGGMLAVGDTILSLNDERMTAEEMMQLLNVSTVRLSSGVLMRRPLILTVSREGAEAPSRRTTRVDWWHCTDSPGAALSRGGGGGGGSTANSLASSRSASSFDDLALEGDDEVRSARYGAAQAPVSAQPCMVVAGGPAKSRIWEVRTGRRGGL